jgi:hypothetical protein
MPIQTHTRRKQRRIPSLPDVSTLHPNQILSLSEWCALNGFSIRTGRRIRASGDGPVVIKLSPNRIGITVADNARWQRSRASKTAAPQRRRTRTDQPDFHAE